MIYVSIIIIAIILISFSIHEFSHAWIANRLGDSTARLDGRLTLNPLAHWDPIGTTLLVGLLFLQGLGVPVAAFGWGKPVPINDRHFSNPKKGNLIVGLAGPLSNVIIAIILSLALNFFIPASSIFYSIIITTITINIFLAIFNLIPIPPLDGSHILQGIISDEAYARFAQNSSTLIILLIIIILVFPSFLTNIVGQIVHLLTS